MAEEIDNWKIQIRKGYLELCILGLIQTHKKLYGFDLLEKLKDFDLALKEGTLYPLLNRMTGDKLLSSFWETENNKGHPRKFYQLTKDGARYLDEMISEFEKMIKIFRDIQR